MTLVQHAAERAVDRNCWSTPPELFARLHAEHRFTVDAAANAANAKLPHYWDEITDGLAQDWLGERVFVNPPYGRGLIEPWVDKALRRRADLVCLLLPARTESRWFQAVWAAVAVGHATVDFLPARVKFVPPPGVRASSPTEASVVVLVKGGRS